MRKTVVKDEFYWMDGTPDDVLYKKVSYFVHTPSEEVLGRVTIYHTREPLWYASGHCFSGEFLSETAAKARLEESVRNAFKEIG